KMKVFFTLFIAIFAAMLGLGIIAPFMPLYAVSMGATGLWLGIIFSAFGISKFIFTPRIGKISDEKGKRKIIIIGLSIYAIISLLYIIANSVYALTIIRALHGFASAMVVPVALAYIAERAPNREEGKYLGTFNVAFFSGIGIGPFLGGFLYDHFSIVISFFSMFLLTLFSLIFVFLFVPEKTSDKRKGSKGWYLLKEKKVQGLYIFRAFNFIGRGAIMTFLSIFAFSYGISVGGIGILLTTNLLIMALFQPFLGKLADRYDREKLTIIGGLTGAVPLLFIPYSTSFLLLLIINITVGFGGAIGMPSSQALIAEVGREEGMGGAMAILDSATSLGMILGPIISGIVMDFMSINWVFYFGGAFGVLGTFIFLILVRIGE
ncbi:MAG: MFS transporter, partial [Candidatus Thermoplasmatota archaeon]